MLNLLIKAFRLSDEIVVRFDDTVERIRGKKIKAKGIYRDAARSSKSFFVETGGLSRLSFMLLTEAGFAGRVWALPFLTVLCPSAKYDQQGGRRRRCLTDRPRQAVLLIKRWLPHLALVFVGDSSYAETDLLAAVREKATLVSSLRLDAELCRKAATRRKGQIGRPRKKGKRLPTLQSVIENPKTKWKAVSIENWYGEQKRSIEKNLKRKLCCAPAQRLVQNKSSNGLSGAGNRR